MRFHDSYAGFHHLVLPNGLTLSVQERPEVSWFYTGVVIHAGAREDPKGRQELAHLVEHLVSENVAGMTFPQLEQRLKTLGARSCL